MSREIVIDGQVPKRFVEDANLLKFFVDWLTKSENPERIANMLTGFTSTEIVAAFMSTQYQITITNRDAGDENTNG